MSSMKDQLCQHAQRIVVKRNTCTEDKCNNTQSVGTSSQSPIKTCTFNKWNRMHVHDTISVSVCIIISRQVIVCHIMPLR